MYLHVLFISDCTILTWTEYALFIAVISVILCKPRFHHMVQLTVHVSYKYLVSHGTSWSSFKAKETSSLQNSSQNTRYEHNNGWKKQNQCMEQTTVKESQNLTLGNLTASFERDDENLVHIKLVDKHLMHTCLICQIDISQSEAAIDISLWFILLLLVIIMRSNYMHHLPHRKQSIPVSRIFAIISTKNGES